MYFVLAGRPGQYRNTFLCREIFIYVRNALELPDICCPSRIPEGAIRAFLMLCAQAEIFEGEDD